MFIYVHRVLELLYAENNRFPKGLIGACQKMSVVRRTGSKYHVQKEVYPSNSFPIFCFGTAYVLTNDSISDLLRNASTIPLPHLEDASLGILAKVSGTIRIHNIKKPKWRTHGFNHRRCPPEYTIHKLKPNQIENYWKRCSLKP